MDAEKPKCKWFKRLIIQGIDDEAGRGGTLQTPKRFSFQRGSLGSVASKDDGSDLLEDFPSAPRRLSYHGQIPAEVHEFGRDSANKGSIRALDDSFESIPNQQAYEPSPAILTPLKITKQVRITLENSTTHSYERPHMTPQEIKSLYTSKLDKKFFMQSSMTMAKQIRHHLRAVSSRAPNTATDVSNSHAPVFIANSDIPQSIMDELESVIGCMFPSRADLSSNSKLAAEEVIGIEHLIGNKRLLVLLNDMRSYHSKSVLEQCKCYESNCIYDDGAEAISEVSRRISSISLQIARRRAEFVANLE